MKLNLARLLGLAPGKAEADSSPALVVAQLLIEIARSDQAVQEAELGVVRRHLSEAYGLSGEQLDRLIAEAGRQVDAATSLYDTVKRVNEAFSSEQRAELMRALWQVAYADGSLDRHEEALLRRMADLLYVSPSVFIREKLQVLGQT